MIGEADQIDHVRRYFWAASKVSINKSEREGELEQVLKNWTTYGLIFAHVKIDKHISTSDTLQPKYSKSVQFDFKNFN